VKLDFIGWQNAFVPQLKVRCTACLLGRGRSMWEFQCSFHPSFWISSSDRSSEVGKKTWEKSHYFFQFSDSEEFVGKPVEALDDQRTGMARGLSSFRLWLDATMGWMRGLAMDTREVHSHWMLLGVVLNFILKGNSKEFRW